MHTGGRVKECCAKALFSLIILHYLFVYVSVDSARNYTRWYFQADPQQQQQQRPVNKPTFLLQSKQRYGTIQALNFFITCKINSELSAAYLIFLRTLRFITFTILKFNYTHLCTFVLLYCMYVHTVKILITHTCVRFYLHTLLQF